MNGEVIVLMFAVDGHMYWGGEGLGSEQLHIAKRTLDMHPHPPSRTAMARGLCHVRLGSRHAMQSCNGHTVLFDDVRKGLLAPPQSSGVRREATCPCGRRRAHITVAECRTRIFPRISKGSMFMGWLYNYIVAASLRLAVPSHSSKKQRKLKKPSNRIFFGKI